MFLRIQSCVEVVLGKVLERDALLDDLSLWIYLVKDLTSFNNVHMFKFKLRQRPLDVKSNNAHSRLKDSHDVLLDYFHVRSFIDRFLCDASHFASEKLAVAFVSDESIKDYFSSEVDEGDLAHNHGHVFLVDEF
jgi:hypothetical protein